MPSILSDDDKETVKRTVPKPANKIHAVAVARLYVAYPNRQRWTYTGLQGAAVLANDLVGNTYWLKLVDISPSNRGVIWDQEIYDAFPYNQDRTFFHSFELEECMAGLSFVDEKEAKQFKKKMDEREKNASKATKANPFRHHSGDPLQDGHAVTTRKTSLLGGFSNLLHPHRTSSPSNHAPPVEDSRPSLPPPEIPNGSHLSNGTSSSGLDEVDPSWRGLLDELKAMGITEDQIAENADFIKAYVEQKQGTNIKSTEMNGSIGESAGDRRPPPPPPPSLPAGAHRAKSISPQNTGSTISSKRGPPPAPPPSRKSRVDNNHVPSPPHTPTSLSTPPPPPIQAPPRAQSPPRGPPPPRFRAPPPIADAGKFAHSDPAPAPPPRPQVSANSGPPPPPRPPKVPMDDDSPQPKQKFAVPPPLLDGERLPSSLPPRPPPSRNIPPPAPNREATQSLSTNLGPPPPPPPLPVMTRPQIPAGGPPPAPAAPPPPPLPNIGINPLSATNSSNQANIPTAPPLPPISTASRPVMMDGVPPAPPPPAPPLPTSFGNAPPAPPLPSSGVPPAPPPPAPPLPSSSSNVPPPPPLPSQRDSGYQSGPPSAPPLPKPTGGKEDMLASIRATGGIGGGRLRKVDESQKRDRSAVVVPGSSGSGGVGMDHSSSSTAAATGEAGLADALAAVLSKRKTRVSQSDDEEEDDDWDDTR